MRWKTSRRVLDVACAACGRSVAKLIRAAKDDRYKTALLLASVAELRIGEIRGVQWTDIKDGRLTIRRSIDTKNNVGPPNHNKIRTVKLSPAMQDALAALPRRGLWIVGRLEDGDRIDDWPACLFRRSRN